MPVRDLIRAISATAPEKVPAEVTEVSEGLMYRDFITVGLLASRLAVTEKDGSPLKDNWIYIQEPDVVVGRLQIFNNWSPWLVAGQDKVWIGLEYFCNETDPLWKLSDDEMARFAIAEIAKIGILKAEDVEDAHVVRVPKTYPAYFGSYDRFDVIRSYLDRFENLFLVGRNGMHKYNNQDHSMLTAMTAVENIVNELPPKTISGPSTQRWSITRRRLHSERAIRYILKSCRETTQPAAGNPRTPTPMNAQTIAVHLPDGPFVKCPPAPRPLKSPTPSRRGWLRPPWWRG